MYLLEKVRNNIVYEIFLKRLDNGKGKVSPFSSLLLNFKVSSLAGEETLKDKNQFSPAERGEGSRSFEARLVLKKNSWC